MKISSIDRLVNSFVIHNSFPPIEMPSNKAVPALARGWLVHPLHFSHFVHYPFHLHPWKPWPRGLYAERPSLTYNLSELLAFDLAIKSLNEPSTSTLPLHRLTCLLREDLTDMERIIERMRAAVHHPRAYQEVLKLLLILRVLEKEEEADMVSSIVRYLWTPLYIMLGHIMMYGQGLRLASRTKRVCIAHLDKAEAKYRNYCSSLNHHHDPDDNDDDTTRASSHKSFPLVDRCPRPPPSTTTATRDESKLL